MSHAEYAPSSMHLTVHCPGWRKQASTIPPQLATEATTEGEAAHWVAKMVADGNGGDELDALKVAPNGAEIDDEMRDAADVWCEALEGYPARLETPVQITRLHPTKCWGTPDALQWAPETKTIRVADYKYGHEFVDEFENWQLLAYAVGIVDELGLMDDTAVKLEMTVVQPRFYNAAPIRTWTIQTAGLKHYAERMRTAIAEAESTNPRTMSGTHCTHCPARVNCLTFAKAVMHAVDFTGRADPMVSTAEQIGRELKLVQEFLRRLKARETGLAAMAEGMIRNGQRVPFYSLEQTTGRLAWTVPLEVVEMSAQMNGKSALKPPALITPTQAKKLGILDTSVISEYSERPMGALKLVPESTKVARKFTA